MPWPPVSNFAASSTLARSRTAIILVATVVTAVAAYQIFDIVLAPSPGSRLRRRNSVHRRRRRTTGGHGNNPSSSPAEEANQTNGTQPLGDTILPDVETVVDEQYFQEEYPSWTSMQPPLSRNGQNIVQLLFRVSEDATRRNAYVHRGCACNGCAMVPIRGIRYRCANCADYDLCEGCEAQGVHTRTHIFYKIKIPAPATGPRNIQPVWYSGDPDSVPRVLPKETMAKLSMETGFERPELDAYWEQWTYMANTDWRDDPYDINLAMDRKTFERCLVPCGGYRHSAPSLIFDRMFAFYDNNKDDLIGFPEFLHGVAFRKRKDKWKKIFEGYDIDGDGYVDRRDFLRMFRSYYVLYRQMHRDMLEGVEEQQMNTTDAHRLVNSRQPLSSAFGQDGRFPRAPDRRTGEGKTAQANGDMDIFDGKGVINESSNDTGNREEVFRRDLPRPIWGDRFSAGYWRTMLNPPETLDQLPDVFLNLQRVRGQIFEQQNGPDASARPALLVARNEIHVDSSSESDGLESDQAWPPSFVDITDEDAERVDGPGTRVADVRRSSRREVISHALTRLRAEEEVYERWQRRHFYTDEEEGATPPADWKDDDDILVHSGMAGESSKFPRATFHSRSSSKVRFAKDADDFDTRSNPSTSSRSVPERWGGIEIPDAEKDAGREILFQVTQQAFNELLDPLFKQAEDIAVEAAKTKCEREKYRHLYETSAFRIWVKEQILAEQKIELEKQAATLGMEGEMPSHDGPSEDRTNLAHHEATPIRDHATQHSQSTSWETDDSEMPLERLLLTAVYSVVPEDQNEQHSEDQSAEAISNDEETATPPNPQVARSSAALLPSSSGLNHRNQSHAPMDHLSVASHDETHRGLERLGNTAQVVPRLHRCPESSPTYRDPTMPQFRPDNLAERSSSTTTCPHPTAVSEAEFISKVDHAYEDKNENREQYGRPANPTPESEEQCHIVCDITRNSTPPNTATADPTAKHKEKERGGCIEGIEMSKLYSYWLSDHAAEEAEKRGGWGRLSLAEFEAFVKDGIDSGRDRMEYLGSWIEFCIP